MQFDRAAKICEILKSKVPEMPDTAVILGSGLGKFATEIKEECAIEYKDIEGFPVPTVQGHAGRLIFGSVAGKRIIAMQGRFHLYEGYSVEDVTLPERVFKLLGVRNLIVTNAAGGVNRNFAPGDLVLIRDHVGLFCPSPLFGANDSRFGERFPSMSEAYSKKLSEIAFACAKDEGIDLKSGVYCFCKGPMYETPAEIRLLSSLGVDCVGMSTVPEVIVAAHCGISVLGISCVTNMAAGIGEGSISHSEVMAAGKAVEDKFSALMKSIISKM